MKRFNLLIVATSLILGCAEGRSSGPPIGPTYPTLCQDMNPSGHAPATAQTSNNVVTVGVCSKGDKELKG